MNSFKTLVAGLGLLAMTSGSSSALTQLEAYCDNYAQDYARQSTKVGVR